MLYKIQNNIEYTSIFGLFHLAYGSFNVRFVPIEKALYLMQTVNFFI